MTIYKQIDELKKALDQIEDEDSDRYKIMAFAHDRLSQFVDDKDAREAQEKYDISDEELQMFLGGMANKDMSLTDTIEHMVSKRKTKK